MHIDEYMHIIVTAKLIVENSALTGFRFLPLAFALPDYKHGMLLPCSLIFDQQAPQPRLIVEPRSKRCSLLSRIVNGPEIKVFNFDLRISRKSLLQHAADGTMTKAVFFIHNQVSML
jgi:hypothetical protein